MSDGSGVWKHVAELERSRVTEMEDLYLPQGTRVG